MSTDEINSNGPVLVDYKPAIGGRELSKAHRAQSGRKLPLASILVALGAMNPSLRLMNKPERQRAKDLKKAVGIPREFYRSKTYAEPSLRDLILQSNSRVEIENLIADARAFKNISPKSLSRCEQAAERRLRQIKEAA